MLKTVEHALTDIPDFPDGFESVLHILAATALADHKMRDPELIEFTHCAHTHLQRQHPDEVVCPTQFKAWFKSQKIDIDCRLNAENSKTYIEDLLGQITDPSLQRQLLTSIYNIAICDYDLADEECDFIQTALRVWDNELPDPEDVSDYT